MDMDKARVSFASLAPSVRLYINRTRRVQGPGAQPGVRGENGCRMGALERQRSFRKSLRGRWPTSFSEQEISTV